MNRNSDEVNKPHGRKNGRTINLLWTEGLYKDSEFTEQ